MPSNCMFRGKWHSGEMVFGGNDTQSPDRKIFPFKKGFKKEWQIKIAHEKGLNFMRNPKLAHILV